MFTHRRWFSVLGLALLTVILLSSALMPQVRADSIYVVPDDVGWKYSYAMIVNNGNPVVSYYSKTTSNIVVALCGNPSCETNLTVIHPIETVILTDVAITVVNGNPLIVYSTLETSTTSHVRVAACVDALCNQAPIITTLDTGLFGKVAVTLQNGKALIAYQVSSPNQDHDIVKLAFCGDLACTTSTIQPLSITDGVSGSRGLAVGLLNGKPIVVYSSWQAISTITLLKCLSATCTETPTLKTVDSNGLDSYGIAMTNGAGTPILTYTTRENSVWWVKAATCTDASCDNTMYVHTVGEAADYGKTAVNLVNGLPMIAYEKNGIRLARCLDTECNYSSSIQLADASHSLPLVQSSQNYPIVTFLQDINPTSSKLKAYFGGVFNPVQSLTPSNTPTDTLVPTATRTLSSTPPTATFTITPSITPTASSTHTPTYTPSPTSTHTPTYTPSPTLITPTSMLNAPPIVNFYTTHTVTLTWNRVSWATGYELQISTDIYFAPAVTDTQLLPASSLAYTTGNLANATYYWRVKALGNVGGWSNLGQFVVSAPT